MEDKAIRVLEKKGITPTPSRVLILRAMYGFDHAFSMADIEDAVGTVDKSTVSRTISLFSDVCIVHKIDDGTGSLKYGFCDENCNCGAGCIHLHFHCLKCGKTYCLKDLPAPCYDLPEGFVLRKANFVIKGYCPSCSKSATQVQG